MAEAEKSFSLYDVAPRNRFQLENINGFRYFIPKRGHPTGFQGTRGKKDFDFVYKRLGFNGEFVGAFFLRIRH